MATRELYEYLYAGLRRKNSPNYEGLFKDESVLDDNNKTEILFREKEFEGLRSLFSELIMEPFKKSLFQFVVGPPGCGKTTTIKLFTEIFEKSAFIQNIYIKVIFINCRRERTPYNIIIKIAQSLIDQFPSRGFSISNILEAILAYLVRKELYIIIVLDEIDFFEKTVKDTIFYLDSINEEASNSSKFLSIIGISDDYNKIISEIRGFFIPEPIIFQNYTPEQYYTILKQKVSLSLKENIISDNLINVISYLAFQKKSLRYSLNLIWKATKIAELQGCSSVTVDCFLKTKEHSLENLNFYKLIVLEDYELIFLLSAIKNFKKNSSLYVALSDVANEFEVLCKQYQLPSRSYAQIWNYSNNLCGQKIISKKVVSKNVKGRQIHLEISESNLETLEKLILFILERRGVEM